MFMLLVASNWGQPQYQAQPPHQVPEKKTAFNPNVRPFVPPSATATSHAPNKASQFCSRYCKLKKDVGEFCFGDDIIQVNFLNILTDIWPHSLDKLREFLGEEGLQSSIHSSVKNITGHEISGDMMIEFYNTDQERKRQNLPTLERRLQMIMFFKSNEKKLEYPCAQTLISFFDNWDAKNPL